MDSKSLEKNLANLERELVALQTAHDIGLGVVKYYQFDDVATPVHDTYYYVWLCINVKDGERLNPMLNWYIDDTQNIDFNLMVKSETYPGRYALIVLSIFSTPSIQWRLVSTSQLEYYYASSAEEVEAWIGEYV